MRVILEIDNFDNDAMVDIDPRDLKFEIKEKMAQALINYNINLEGSRVYDYNGNRVGGMIIQI